MYHTSYSNYFVPKCNNRVLTILLTKPACVYSDPTVVPCNLHSVKTYMRSARGTEKLSSLTRMHAYRDTLIDTKSVVWVFCAKKDRMLAFELYLHGSIGSWGHQKSFLLFCFLQLPILLTIKWFNILC